MIGGTAPARSEATLFPAGTDVLVRRFLALSVDVVLLSVLDAIVNSTFGLTRVTRGFIDPMVSGGYSTFTTTTTVDAFWLPVIWVGYYALFEGLFGASPGKAVAHISVVDLQGSRPTWHAIVLRNLVRPIDALPFAYLLGGVLVLATRSHQRLGDRLARTLIVRAQDVREPLPTRTIIKRRVAAVVAGLILFLVICGAFQYWGRPPLVIQGLQRTGQLLGQPVSSYVLGPPRWGSGTVTYPIQFVRARTNQSCNGEISLAWSFPTGWHESIAQSSCQPAIYP